MDPISTINTQDVPREAFPSPSKLQDSFCTNRLLDRRKSAGEFDCNKTPSPSGGFGRFERSPSDSVMSEDLRRRFDDEFQKATEIVNVQSTQRSIEEIESIGAFLNDELSSDDGMEDEDMMLWKHSELLKAQMREIDREQLRKERQQKRSYLELPKECSQLVFEKPAMSEVSREPSNCDFMGRIQDSSLSCKTIEQKTDTHLQLTVVDDNFHSFELESIKIGENEKLLSINASCIWKNQGYDSQPSQVFLKLSRDQQQVALYNLFGVAPHREQPVHAILMVSNEHFRQEFVSLVCPGDELSVGYVISGQKNVLCIQNFRLDAEFSIDENAKELSSVSCEEEVALSLEKVIEQDIPIVFRPQQVLRSGDPVDAESLELMNRYVELQQWSDGPRLLGQNKGLHDYSGILAAEEVGVPRTAVIVYAVQIIVRPDAPHKAILLCLEQTFYDLELQVSRAHDSGMLLEGFWSTLSKPQRWIDVQIGIETTIKQRVVYLQFYRQWTYGNDFMSGFSGNKADEYKRKNREWAKKVMDACWKGLQEAGLVLDQLRTKEIYDCPVESLDAINLEVLDSHFKNQLYGHCREEMAHSLEQATQHINDYVKNAEVMAGNLLDLMKPMYIKYGFDVPPFPDELPLACYSRDLLNVESSYKDWLANSSVDVGVWRPRNELEKMNWVVEMAYCNYSHQCSQEMALRMQRKNLQAMDRLSKLFRFERALIKNLRDAPEVLQSKTSMEFTEKVQVFLASMSSDKECPIYDCECSINKSPGVLYITYWHIWVVSSLTGGAGSWVLKIDFRDIEQVEVQKKLFLVGKKTISLVTRTQGNLMLSPTNASCTKISYLIELLIKLHNEPEDALEFPLSKLLKQRTLCDTFTKALNGC